MSEKLTDLTTELEEAATKLRSSELSSEDAAELIDRCAKLLGDLGGELDRLSWAIPTSSGYETLGQMSIEDRA